MGEREVLVVYDRQCPVCEAYCRMARLRESAGPLRRVDAREDSAVMEEITRRGLDIDQGMVVKVGDSLYYGADAIHALARMSSRSGVFNRLSHWLFRSRTRARLLYPILRALRNFLLKALRRTRVNNLKLPGNQRF